jgi:hypothetical protein
MTDMDADIIIKIGGLYNLGFLVFHAMFWKLFKWKKELPKLTRMNGAIVQVMNLCLMFCFLFFGYISLCRTSELIVSSMGRALLLFIALFWLIRAIEQLVFFSHKRRASITMFILFLLGFGFYAYPLIRI